MTTSKLIKNKYISAAATLVAVAALVLTGCSQDIDIEDNKDNSNIDNIVRFDVGIQDDMGTRAIRTAEDLKNGSGVIYFENNYCKGTITYENGSWVGKRLDVGSGDYPLVWKDMDSTTDVIAYYSSGGYFEYDNQGQQFLGIFPEDQSSYVPDFLFFMKKDFVPSSNSGRIQIDLKHMFALLDIVVNFGSEQASNPVTDLKVGGIITEVKMTPTTFDESGIPVLEADERYSAEDITPYENFVSNSTAVTYECSVLPQTVSAGNLSVSFTMNGKSYIWRSTKEMTFTAGKRNKINITIE